MLTPQTINERKALRPRTKKSGSGYEEPDEQVEDAQLAMQKEWREGRGGRGERRF